MRPPDPCHYPSNAKTRTKSLSKTATSLNIVMYSFLTFQMEWMVWKSTATLLFLWSSWSIIYWKFRQQVRSFSTRFTWHIVIETFILHYENKASLECRLPCFICKVICCFSLFCTHISRTNVREKNLDHFFPRAFFVLVGGNPCFCYVCKRKMRHRKMINMHLTSYQKNPPLSGNKFY